MARTYPQNPLARLINARLSTLGISRPDLMHRLGYSNQVRGLRRFDDFLATGQITTHLLKGLPDVLGLDTVDVEAEAATTRQEIADKEEAIARERFHPHILVLTELPPGIHLPAFAQMFTRGQKVVGLPDEFVRLPSTLQVRQAARIVRRHFREHRGMLGVWGTITGYRLQLTYDHAVLLNVDGTVREGFHRRPEPPAPELRIGGKRIPVGMFGGGMNFICPGSVHDARGRSVGGAVLLTRRCLDRPSCPMMDAPHITPCCPLDSRHAAIRSAGVIVNWFRWMRWPRRRRGGGC